MGVLLHGRVRFQCSPRQEIRSTSSAYTAALLVPCPRQRNIRRCSSHTIYVVGSVRRDATDLCVQREDSPTVWPIDTIDLLLFTYRFAFGTKNYCKSSCMNMYITYTAIRLAACICAGTTRSLRDVLSQECETCLVSSAAPK
jgi:hypothetical protein